MHAVSPLKIPSAQRCSLNVLLQRLQVFYDDLFFSAMHFAYRIVLQEAVYSLTALESYNSAISCRECSTLLIV